MFFRFTQWCPYVPFHSHNCSQIRCYHSQSRPGDQLDQRQQRSGHWCRYILSFFYYIFKGCQIHKTLISDVCFQRWLTKLVVKAGRLWPSLWSMPPVPSPIPCGRWTTNLCKRSSVPAPEPTSFYPTTTRHRKWVSSIQTPRTGGSFSYSPGSTQR